MDGIQRFDDRASEGAKTFRQAFEIERGGRYKMVLLASPDTGEGLARRAAIAVFVRRLSCILQIYVKDSSIRQCVVLAAMT